MNKLYTIKDALSSTATYNENEDVFEYIVCWKSKNWDWEWHKKYFAQKKNAKKFAKEKKKECKTKPYPYIFQRITSRNAFKKEIECEICNLEFKNAWQKSEYRKFIKY